jgi:hypothetical protein
MPRRDRLQPAAQHVRISCVISRVDLPTRIESDAKADDRQDRRAPVHGLLPNSPAARNRPENQKIAKATVVTMAHILRSPVLRPVANSGLPIFGFLQLVQIHGPLSFSCCLQRALPIPAEGLSTSPVRGVQYGTERIAKVSIF